MEVRLGLGSWGLLARSEIGDSELSTCNLDSRDLEASEATFMPYIPFVCFEDH